MERPARGGVIVRVLVFCLLAGSPSRGDNAQGRETQKDGVVIEVGSFKVTDGAVELRCQIRNGTSQDIWVCMDSRSEAGRRISGARSAEVFMDRDLHGLVVLRRMKRPYQTSPGGLWGAEINVPYARLRAGLCRPEVLLVALPVPADTWLDDSRGFIRAAEQGVDTVTRLAFEVGYYTAEDIESSIAHPQALRQIRRDNAGDLVYVGDMISFTGWSDERAARLTVEGVCVPFRRWLGEGAGTASAEPHPTPLQKLQGFFYDGSLGAGEYEYAQRLFGLDEELLDARSRQVRGVFTQVAEGRGDPAGLTGRLEAILGSSERHALLNQLQEKQSLATQQRQARIRDLLAEAGSHDSQAQGRKALAALREVLALEPSQPEALDLMRRVSAYYKGQVMRNTIGMELAWIPSGEFLMGSKDRRDMIPLQPRVRISRGFWMGVREVTNAQYEAIMGASPERVVEGEACPVDSVSWYDAIEFCRRLRQKEGRTYRLPTEAEWEYACRAGTTTDYWWGDDWASGDPNKANGFGLYDMHGSVGEWCHDWYGSLSCFFIQDLDPQGPSDPDADKARVVRGGGTRVTRKTRDDQVPSYVRDRLPPERTSRNIGFRVLLDPNAPGDPSEATHEPGTAPPATKSRPTE
jgi:formylglycine-generating enzyme required for sulfatase activity